MERLDPILLAEDALIGSCARNGAHLDRLRVEPRHFTRESTQAMWECLLALRAEGEDIDHVTVTARLHDAGYVEFVEPFANILDSTFDTPNVEAYAQILTSTIEDRHWWREMGKAYKNHDQDEIIRLVTALADHDRASGRRIIEGTLAEGWQLFGDRQASRTHKLTSGIERIDQALGGLYGGRMYVVMARPGMGKTAFAMHIALANATQGMPVGFLSLEQSLDEIAARVVSIHSGRTLLQVQGDEECSDLDTIAIDVAKKGLSQLPILVNDQAPIDIDRVRANARRMVEVKGCRLIVIDYLQKIQTAGRRDRHEEVAGVAMAIKDLSRQLNVPIVALAQARRDSEGKRPTMADLRDSGFIEQEADVIIALHRDMANDETRGVVELIVLKNRHGESGLLYQMAYVGRCFRFCRLQRGFDGNMRPALT